MKPASHSSRATGPKIRVPLGFGTTVIGTRGQVVIPKSARDMLEMQVGDMLIVLGDTNPDTKGIALVPADAFLKVAKDTLENFYPKP